MRARRFAGPGILDPDRDAAGYHRPWLGLVDRRLGKLREHTLRREVLTGGPGDGLRRAEPDEHGARCVQVPNLPTSGESVLEPPCRGGRSLRGGAGALAGRSRTDAAVRPCLAGQAESCSNAVEAAQRSAATGRRGRARGGMSSLWLRDGRRRIADTATSCADRQFGRAATVASRLWVTRACVRLDRALAQTLTAALDSFISFFFNDTATTEIYTLSLHDALPI